MIDRVSRLGPTWPLSVVFLGLPLWWLLGIMQLMYFLMAVPMAVYLLRQRRILIPRGYGTWLVLVLWLLTGLAVLQVTAPSGVPGSSAARYLTFGYRFGWYVVSTIVCLFVLNVRGTDISQRVMRVVAWVFVVFIAGGVIGTLFPTISFPSLLQAAMPRGLANNGFVHDLLHVQVAQIQNFLGYDEARPSAPFPFTNDWGMATTCALPFFVAAWWNRSHRWRIAAVAVLAVATWVIVGSLNRGMWLGILAMVVFVVVHSAVQGNTKLLTGAAAALAVFAVVIVLSPLGGLVQERLDNPHSNEGRSNLGLTAISSVAQGSPVVGFGTTREVAGNFTSIAGGASESCPKCSPPPLGTHGQLWHLTFVAGFIGIALYLWFIFGQFLRHLRVDGFSSVASLCVLVVLIVTLPIYTSVGVPLYLGSIAVGLLARTAPSRLPSLHHLTQPIMRHQRLIVFGLVTGAMLGLVTNAVQGHQISATQRVLTPAADLVGVPGVRPFTMDSEAGLATSDAVLSEVASALAQDQRSVSTALELGAEANTRVLIFTYRDRDPQAASRGVEVAVGAYLRLRNDMLRTAQDELEHRYVKRQGELDDLYRETASVVWAPGVRPGFLRRTLAELRADAAATMEAYVGRSGGGEAQVISSVSVSRSSDLRTIRLASGGALGLLLTVPLIWLVDRRWPRLNSRGVAYRSLALPLLGSVLTTKPHDVRVLARSFLPLAGLVADPSCPRAVELVANVDRAWDRMSPSGSRVILVVESGTSVARIRELSRTCANAGMDAVGIIVAFRESRRAPAGIGPSYVGG